MIAQTEKEIKSVVHLKCPNCGSDLEYMTGKKGDYFCCPHCNGYNFNAQILIRQMARYIDRLEKSEIANDPNPQD